MQQQQQQQPNTIRLEPVELQQTTPPIGLLVKSGMKRLWRPRIRAGQNQPSQIGFHPNNGSRKRMYRSHTSG